MQCLPFLTTLYLNILSSMYYVYCCSRHHQYQHCHQDVQVAALYLQYQHHNLLRLL